MRWRSLRLEQTSLGNSPQASRKVSACVMGHFAPARRWLPDPDDPLRKLWRQSGAAPICWSSCRTMSSSTVRAIRSTVMQHGAMEVPGKCGADARRENRYDGHVRRSVLVLCALYGTMGKTNRLTTRSPITGCRSISISAVSNTRSCICSIRVSSPAR